MGPSKTTPISIIVVGDDSHFLSVVHKLESEDGYLLHTCGDPQSALLEFESGEYDIIIADYLRDLKDDFSFFSACREGFDDLLFIFLVKDDMTQIRIEPVLGNARFLSYAPEDISSLSDGIRKIFKDYQDDIHSDQNRKKNADLVRNLMNGYARISICDEDSDPVFKIIEINPAFLTGTGLSEGEVLGRIISEAFPKTGDELSEILTGVAITGDEIKTELHFTDVGKYFEITAFQSEPDEITCLFNDITDQIQRFDELQMITQQFEQISSLTREGFLILDKDGTIIYSNAGAGKILNVISDLTGRNVIDILSDEDKRPVSELIEYFCQIEEYGVLHFIMPDGTKERIRVSGAPLVDAYGSVSGIVMVLHGIISL